MVKHESRDSETKQQSFSDDALAAVAIPDAKASGAVQSAPARHLAGPAVYESDESLNQYLAMHFATISQTFAFGVGPRHALDFPKRCADLCREFAIKIGSGRARALDVGCAVGRSTFELTRFFGHVLGVDFSHQFVQAAQELKDKGKRKYKLLWEGRLTRDAEAVVDAEIDRSKAHFVQGDACDLPADMGAFDCVLAANLICRLPNPTKFLRDLARLVKPGGLVVITSPYTWMADYTPVEKWLGGKVDEHGKEVSSFDALRATLEPAFVLLSERDEPFLIRETARKNQWTVAHVTMWKRCEEPNVSA